MAGRYLDTESFKIDKEFQELLPYLKEDEYKQLEENILTYGLLDPIKIWISPKGENIIIDGHHRYKILKKNNIELMPWTDYKILNELKTREDVKEWMMEQQLGRRNLSDAEKYEIVQRFKSLIQNKGKQNNSNGGKGLTNLSKVNTRKELAEKVGISEGTYSKLDKVMQSDNEEIIQKLRKKEISIDKAYKEIREPIEQKKETTADVDRKLEKLDDEIKRIEKEKNNMYLRRQKIFNDTPDKTRCEIEFRKSEELFLYSDFYLIKGVNKIKIIENFLWCEDSYDEYVKKIDSRLRYTSLTINYELTKQEKNIVFSKFHSMKDEILKKIKETDAERSEEIHKKFSNCFENAFRNNDIENPLIGEIINAGYKALAKKYHPDVTGDDGSKMQKLNHAKEQLFQLI